MDNFNSAVILAGGKSLRMEFDKQCLIIDNQRLIFKLAKKLEKHFKDITIVTNKKEYYEGCKYNLVSDKMQNKGPLAGIAVGLGQSISDYAYMIACDMPNIDDRYISYMKEKINKDIKNKANIDIYICKLDDRIQLFQGFYKKVLEEEINDYLINGSRKSIISFFEKTNKKVKYIECQEFKDMNFRKDIFINLNTKEDLNIYQKGI
ncbi:MAG: molybdenum cofactor guanylyltransferase [Romboutsia sp.]|uniref:molybdenum cofactor guanylyltransferase n=1 Tax=Romboutsia sp. TaxID=1965302 RepID=UPI003F407D03